MRASAALLRRALLPAAAGLGALLLPSCWPSPESAPAGSEAPPTAGAHNLLFVLSDQHRGDALGCAGHPVAHTPNLDRLAASGVRLSSAYVPAPLCVPSRASLMTGRPIDLHGALTNKQALPPGTPTWPRVLSEFGFRTLSVGRVHGICGGFEHRQVPGIEDLATASMPLAEGAHWDSLVTAAALDSLAELAEGDRPFALYVGYISPHPPFKPPAPFAHSVREERLPAPLGGAVGASEPLPWLADPPADDSIRKRRRALRARYFELTSFVDHEVGRLLDGLEELDLTSDTLVVYTSDHGAPLHDHGVRQKYVNFQEGIVRVPLILKMPGGLPAGAVLDEPIGTLDLAPTILSLLGAPPLAGATGHDLSPWLRGSDSCPRAAVFSSIELSAVGRRGERGYMRRSAGWKYCWYSGGHEELFDLLNDPDELQSLHSHPEHLDRLRANRASLLEYLVELLALAPGNGAGDGGELLLETRAGLAPLVRLPDQRWELLVRPGEGCTLVDHGAPAGRTYGPEDHLPQQAQAQKDRLCERLAKLLALRLSEPSRARPDPNCHD